ncbi:hypothetical protein ILZ93_004546 [Escherichia coli]|jgi:hypothetical protein|nr:hypothetical protein [Salmonella enterica subsp. enterica serovar Adelaide]EBX1746919.1 hypothetical protein [Salmonella enterica subsp. enterica serovar Cerro]ECW2403697.1 hypothetical protein [Salmonella enterica]EFD5524510.1 hypothetical protein [Escherichia coli]EGI6478777.1 hypothetical protein [Salmonella enterica subsp. enterica serovar Johannesburg]MIF85161.1 hypothetical protein [Salmonella enterica subsp. enterica]HCC6221778.1 hypothetical protein [Klebsiella pneumoniae]
MISFMDFIKNSATTNIEEVHFNGSADLEVTKTKAKSDFFNEILKSSKRNSSSSDFSYLDDEKLPNYIYNTFLYDDISYESTPKTKYVIENISRELGVQKVDYALLDILSKKIFKSSDEDIVKFLALLSSFDVETIPLTSLLSVTSLYSHKSDVVKESVLSTVECWEWPDIVEYLERMEDFKRPYLQKYKEEVIENLRSL